MVQQSKEKYGPGSSKSGSKRSGSSSVSDADGKDISKAGIDPVVAYLATVAVVTLSSVAIERGRQAVEKSRTDKKISELSDQKTTKVDPETGFHLRDTKEWTEDDLKNVNPLWDEGATAAVSQNCVLCTATVEMRRRGYDVAAKSTPRPTDALKIMSSVYPGGKAREVGDPIVDLDALSKNKMQMRKGLSSAYVADRRSKAWMGENTDHAEKVLSNLSKEPDSRGLLTMIWGAGGGHAVAYEVKNGKVTILDGQSGTTYTGQEAKDLLANTWIATIYRYDNLDFDLKSAKEYMI